MGKNKEYFKESWHYLDTSRKELALSANNMLFKASTSLLALSVGFTEFILSNLSSGIGNKEMLGLGWGLLVLTVVLTLFAPLLSSQAHAKEMVRIKKKNQEAEYESRNYWTYLERISTWGSNISFVFAIVVLSWFYYLQI